MLSSSEFEKSTEVLMNREEREKVIEDELSSTLSTLVDLELILSHETLRIALSPTKEVVVVIEGVRIPLKSSDSLSVADWRRVFVYRSKGSSKYKHKAEMLLQNLFNGIEARCDYQVQGHLNSWFKRNSLPYKIKWLIFAESLGDKGRQVCITKVPV